MIIKNSDVCFRTGSYYINISSGKTTFSSLNSIEDVLIRQNIFFLDLLSDFGVLFRGYARECLTLHIYIAEFIPL